MLYTGDNPDLKSDNVWAIDMTVFSYHGRLYAVCSGWEKPALTDKTSQHLYIAEMANPITVKSPRIKLSSPDEKWKTGGPLDLQEGPEILKNGDDLIIIYSCRESWTVDYRLGMLKLKSNGSNTCPRQSGKNQVRFFRGHLGQGTVLL
jgi:GH43 family beta-xylosidase